MEYIPKGWRLLSKNEKPNENDRWVNKKYIASIRNDNDIENWNLVGNWDNGAEIDFDKYYVIRKIEPTKFEQDLEATISQVAPMAIEIKRAISVLRVFADFIETKTSAIKDSKVTVTPEYPMYFGQQINITLNANGKDSILFRAYVPTTGFPVKLDFHGEEFYTCKNEEELKESLVNFVKELMPKINLFIEAWGERD